MWSYLRQTLVLLSAWGLCVSAVAQDGAVAHKEDSLDAVDVLAQELEDTVALGQESEAEISIDAEGSMDAPEEDDVRTWTVRSDMRAAATYANQKPREGEPFDETDALGRARIGLARSLGKQWRIGARLSASCTSDSCRPDSFFDEESQGNSSSALAFDEAFFHWYQSDRFDLAVGRMQTKFITKGGVFAKSMDRNDSNGTRITWTDGAHGSLNIGENWESHLILQYNPEEGPTQILREPLNFEDPDSRISAFVSLINEKPVRFLTQRAFDISYYPAALDKDGLNDESRVEDYWGFTGRIAGRYPKRSSGRRMRFSFEAAYAPETPTRSAVGFSGSGDSNGLAAAATLAFMDFFPNHSVGLNLAHTGAGWLLSPQYNKNEELAEIRYVWLVKQNLTFDFRLRFRKEIDQLISAERKREELDFFARLTWRLTRERKALVPHGVMETGGRK